MELKGKKVNFLGDSITEGVGTSSPEHIYLNVLAKSAGLAAARNYGIGGTRFARQIVPTSEIFDRDFCKRVEEMDPDADVVVIFGGTNDFGHGDAPIGTPEDSTPASFWGACNYLFKRVIERYPAAAIVVMTPLHRHGENFTDGDAHQKKYHYGNLKTYVDIIKAVAEKYSLPVLDLYGTAGIQPSVRAQQELFMPDGLHPNDAGNAKIAARLESFLKNL
ncbi:MAG: SGNH/GDSL hydrolase family protein [Clostridia bacterium]|nr:SGNH/GDSL hydrolase family protein [Clostridia bacterium]